MTSTPPMGWWRSCRGSFGFPFPCPGTRCGSSTPTSSGGGTAACSSTPASAGRSAAQALQEGLRAAGAEEDPLDVFLTHIHTDHTGLASEVVRPGGVLYMGEGDFPFTHQAYEDAYWAGIDQRFLREGFPVEELKATRGTNPARNLGPTLDLPNYRMVADGEVLTVGDYTLQVIATPATPRGSCACGWRRRGFCSPPTTSSLTSPPTSPCGPTCPTPWAGTWRVWRRSGPSR